MEPDPLPPWLEELVASGAEPAEVLYQMMARWLEELVAGGAEPAEVLYHILSSADSLTREQMQELASNPLLAQAATHDSGWQLEAALNGWELIEGNPATKQPEAAWSVYDLARLVFCHARSLAEHDRPGAAEFLFARLLPVLARHGTPAEVTECLMRRADALRLMGKIAEAVQGYDEAIPRLREHGDPADLAWCLVRRAQDLHLLQRDLEALASYDEVLSLLGQSETQARVGETDGLANRTLTPGRGDRPETGRQITEADCLANRAITLAGAGRYEEALAGYDAALRLFRQQGLAVSVAVCEMNRGNTLLDLDEHAKALAEYDEALPVLRQRGDLATAARCLANRARALRLLGRPAEAVDALGEVDTSVFREDELCCYHSALGKALWDLGQRDRALDHFTAARVAVRECRQGVGIDHTSLEFRKWAHGFIDQSVCCALDLGRMDEAFAAVQDGKASMLREMWQLRGSGRPDQSYGALALTEAHNCRQRLAEWLRLPPPPGSPGGKDQARWQDELKERTAAYLRAQPLWRGPYWSDVYGWLDPVSGFDPVDHRPELLGRIQAALPPDWAVLDFWCSGAEEVTVFVVFRDDREVRTLSLPFRNRKTLDRRLDRLLSALDNPLALSDHDEALDDLSAYLFAPLLPLLRERDVHGLYLVPHNWLHALPLHMARWTEKGKPVYLGDRFAVAYLPSAALLPLLPPVELNGQLFSLANPERGSEHSLPFADWEACALRRLLRGSAGQFHAGPEATFARTDGWTGAGLVHFGCHGLGDDSFALRSHLRLSDDLLLAADVLHDRPPLQQGALVILNGCQTGMRDWRAVDEGMGLMTAFLLRGASLVLATQWSVLDACAAEMVLTFVDALLEQGTPPTEALRRAQARVRQMTTEDIVARHDEVQKLFPADEFPHEAGKLLARKAWVCHRAGLYREARDCAEQAAAPLRRVGRSADADQLLVLTRGRDVVVRPREYQIASFDHPLFWGAFHFVGRVT
jgi:CHAT domain-containing protein